MKKLLLAAIGLFFPGCSLAEEFGGRADFNQDYGFFTIADSTGSFRASAEISPNLKSLNFFNQPNNGMQSFAAGFLQKNDGLKRAFTARSKYSLEIPVIDKAIGSLSSDSSFAAAILNGEYISQKGDPRFGFTQYLFGFKQYLTAQIDKDCFKLKSGVGGEGSGALLADDYGNDADWDNFGFGIENIATSKFSDSLLLRIETDFKQKKYNPERYFFVEKWVTDLGFRSAAVVSPTRNLHFIPSFNYRRIDIERKLNRGPDLERPEFGMAMEVNNVHKPGISLVARWLYGPWRHKKGNDAVASLELKSKKWSIEVYQRDTKDAYSSFVLEEKITGANLSLRFNIPSRQKLKEIENYGPVFKRKDSFYTDNGIKDIRDLTRVQQAERLGTFRKVNEWNRKNIQWAEANPWWHFRAPDEVYACRKGDSDEQACLTNAMNRQNGYQSHTLDWWVSGGLLAGHAAELVQDPTNGQWFMSEYGMVYKVKVDPKADLAAVGKAALQQNNAFTSLPLRNYSDPHLVNHYAVGDCSQLGTYNLLVSGEVGAVPQKLQRPQIEYGFELFSKKDVLFDYDDYGK